jgi:adenylate/nucleoside-diphosphate kinase
VHIRPIVFVIGKTKTGKTTIAKLLAEKLKLVRIKVSFLLEDFIRFKLDPLSQKAKAQLASGGTVDTEIVIQLLMKRT